MISRRTPLLATISDTRFTFKRLVDELSPLGPGRARLSAWSLRSPGVGVGAGKTVLFGLQKQAKKGNLRELHLAKLQAFDLSKNRQWTFPNGNFRGNQNENAEGARTHRRRPSSIDFDSVPRTELALCRSSSSFIIQYTIFTRVGVVRSLKRDP